MSFQIFHGKGNSRNKVQPKNNEPHFTHQNKLVLKPAGETQEGKPNEREQRFTQRNIIVGKI